MATQAEVLAANQATFRNAASLLSELGLSSLFTVDARGNPGGWLWQQILNGRETFEEVIPAIEATDVWRDRYAVIVEQRKRRANGENVVPMTPAELLEFEQVAEQRFRNAGLPQWFYQDKTVTHEAILSGLSPVEIEDRVMGALTTVNAIDPEIRNQFRAFYGVANGDAALVAYFLDPDKTEKELDKVALASRAGAMAKDFGLSLSRDQAEMFSLFDMTPAGVAQDLTAISQQSRLYEEGAGEVTDLTMSDGFDAVVLGDAKAAQKLEGRLLRRQANARAGGGGALSTNEGLIGVSEA